MSGAKARGRVFRRGKTWHYIVYDRHGRHVFSDNTNNWQAMLDDCLFDVTVARRVESSGHKFRYTYPELVDMASVAGGRPTGDGFPVYGDGFPVYCNTCGGRDGRHSYHCHTDR